MSAPLTPGQLAALPDDALSLVWASVHSAWWGPNRHGYYTDVAYAGIYTLEEAQQIERESDRGDVARPLVGLPTPPHVPETEGTLAARLNARASRPSGAGDRDEAMRIAEAAELADLRRMLHGARFLVGHQGTPTHVMRDIAGARIRASEAAERADAEIERLAGCMGEVLQALNDGRDELAVALLVKHGATVETDGYDESGYDANGIQERDGSPGAVLKGESAEPALRPLDVEEMERLAHLTSEQRINKLANHAMSVKKLRELISLQERADQ